MKSRKKEREVSQSNKSFFSKIKLQIGVSSSGLVFFWRGGEVGEEVGLDGAEHNQMWRPA